MKSKIDLAVEELAAACGYLVRSCVESTTEAFLAQRIKAASTNRQEVNLASQGLEPRMLDVKATSQYLGVTTWFVRSLYWNRAVPALKLGKRILFDKADLDRYIDVQKMHVT